jgi:hypothetical protein
MKIDRAIFPKPGREFVIALRAGSPILLRFKDYVAKNSGFPKISITQFGAVTHLPPNLINVWVFQDESANGKIIGGIAGPTNDHLRDWKEFDSAIEALASVEMFEQAVTLIEAACSSYQARNPHLFKAIQ